MFLALFKSFFLSGKEFGSEIVTQMRIDQKNEEVYIDGK